MVVIYGLKAISGEASVTAAAGPRAKRTRAFDLAFELEWQARACDTHFSGRLLFSEVRSPLSDPEGLAPPGLRPCAFELQPYASRLRSPYVQVASHNEPDEYELSVAFDNEPEAGSEAAATLVNLFGPLRPAAARAAEGKLTRQLWAQVDAFREEFMRL